MDDDGNGSEDAGSEDAGSEDAGSEDARTMGSADMPQVGEENTANEFNVDWEEALAAVNGSESLLAELSAIFNSEGPRLLGQLDTAIAEGDAAGVRIAAHTLRRSAGYFGDTPVSEQASHLEKLAEDGQLDKADEPLARLRLALPQLLSALNERAGK
jgi:HPt (histidine-containing phosphotransfer) domain-containing protein